MAMLAQLYDNGRTAERHPLGADATLRGEDQVPVDILVADLSATGCLFVCTEDLAPDADITIGIAGVGRRQGRVVRAQGQRYGCEFAVQLTEAEIVAARSDPASTIVDFPAWSHPLGKAEDDSTPGGKLAGPVRLAILIGATGIAWTAILLATALLR